MSTHVLCFSPTGGTKKVADLLCSGFSPLPIDLSVRDTDYSALRFAPGDACIFAVPSYGGRVPAIALEHIRQIQGDSTPAVLVAVFGNRDYDDTLLELQREVEARGFHVVGAIAAVAEHSIARRYGKARPDAQDAAELHAFGMQLQHILAQPDRNESLALPGHFPYREYNGVPLKPKAGRACTICGLCARHCPAAAIPIDNPSSTNTSRCISCMRCIAICPTHARTLNPLIAFVAGFKLRKVCSGRKANQFFGGPAPTE